MCCAASRLAAWLSRAWTGRCCWALCTGSYYSEHAENRQTGNGGALASGWLPCLLAVEITTARRPADYSIGNLPAHSRDERREPASLFGRSGSSAFRLSTTSSVERIHRGWNKVHKRGLPSSSIAYQPRLDTALVGFVFSDVIGNGHGGDVSRDAG